ncbi:transmembrane protein 272-like [Littorina saxatilis]|uniref:transmembrane protein 272-like n=1 Tax=Littorina saxatilis TaxID=31220 RepID=UPI0038B60BC3
MSSTGRRVSSVFSVDHSNITPSSLYNGSTSQELYQGGDGWRRTSVDNCQRSEFLQEVLEANKDADSPCDFVCRVTDILSTTGNTCIVFEFLQQVLEANKDADSPCDFVCRVTDILSTTVVSTVLLFLALAVPVIMITVGVKYLENCPLEPRIPIYLLVGGCFLALKLLGMLWKNVQLRRYESMDAFYDSPDSELAFTSRTFKMMDWILSAFLLAWHVVGACWVFALWRPPNHPSLHEPSKYCEDSVYLCAVGEIIVTGALLALGVMGCGVLALCYKYTTVFEQ